MLSTRTPGQNTVPKVLLADDSVTMHRAVTLAMRKEPIELLTCDNGQDALRLAIEHRPAVVLADLDMPGLTGVELCKAIRQEPLLRNTKVVLLCGSFDQVDEARLESAEADGRLWKPFEAHVLVALLSALLKSPVRESADTTGNIADFAARMTEETFSVERKIIASQNPPQVSPPPPRMRTPDPDSATIPPVAAHQPPAWMTSPPEEFLTESPTAPPVPEPTYVPPRADDFFRNDPSHAATSVSDRQATENLWSSDFQPSYSSGAPGGPAQRNETLDDDTEATLDPIYLRSDLEKAKVERQRGFPTVAVPRETLEAPIAPPSATEPPTEAPPSVDHWLADSDLSRFRNVESEDAADIPAQEPTISEERLRTLVRQEIDDAFRGWLRARLQEKLDLVLAEIDRE